MRSEDRTCFEIVVFCDVVVSEFLLGVDEIEGHGMDMEARLH